MIEHGTSLHRPRVRDREEALIEDRHHEPEHDLVYQPHVVLRARRLRALDPALDAHHNVVQVDQKGDQMHIRVRELRVEVPSGELRRISDSRKESQY